MWIYIPCSKACQPRVAKEETWDMTMYQLRRKVRYIQLFIVKTKLIRARITASNSRIKSNQRQKCTDIIVVQQMLKHMHQLKCKMILWGYNMRMLMASRSMIWTKKQSFASRKRLPNRVLYLWHGSHFYSDMASDEGFNCNKLSQLLK